LADEQGRPAQWQHYTAYGDMRIEDASGVSRERSLWGSRLGFHGHLVHPETGLVSMRARVYRPAWGRFLSRDPLGYADGPNLYAFVGSAPLMWRDPFGLSKDRGWAVGALDWVADGASAAWDGVVAGASAAADAAAAGASAALDGAGIAVNFIGGAVHGFLPIPLEGGPIFGYDRAYYTGLQVGAQVGLAADVAMIAGGLIAGGGGIALSGTGAGAAVGVPAIAGGAAVAGAGTALSPYHARRADQAQTHLNEIHSSDRPTTPTTSGPGSGRGSGETTKTDRLKKHILNGEMDAARREAAGEVVARKADGTPWDHVTELRDAQRGLLKRINKIKKELGGDLTDEARAALQKELSEASKLLDKTEEYLPR
jgi:RHS repeat-associated protein